MRLRVMVMTRLATAAAAAAGCAALGTLQVCSDALLRQYADPRAPLQRAPLSADAAAAFAERYLPLPAVRLVLARRAVADRDLARAEMLVASLSVSRDREELAAELADLRGRHARAVDGYLAAGDWRALTSEVERLDGGGDYRAARTLQDHVVGRLERDATHPDALAEGWWRLGILDAECGEREPAARRSWRLRSLVDYEYAVGLAPLSERYLLSAANEALTLREFETAARYFQRVLDVDPKGAQALVGLASVALARGDDSRARGYFERAREIDDQLPDVRRLARKFTS
jgi:tetratricopeptide (TPR) repeat protein